MFFYSTEKDQIEFTHALKNVNTVVYYENCIFLKGSKKEIR